MAQTLSVEEMLPANFTPKMKRHYILAIEGIDAFLVKNSARPTITTDEVILNWINETRYVAGKSKFETLNVVLHDPISPSAAQQVMEWARLCYEPVSGRAGYPDFYKRDIQLKVLDPIGTVIELWDIKGAWCTSINFGDVSSEDGSAMMDVTLTVRFDKAVLQY